MAAVVPRDVRVAMSAPAGARTAVMSAAAADAIRDALAAYRGELVGFVRKRAGHLVDPEDVVHRAAARALASADSLREPARARAWLFRIVRNEMADELRRIGLPVAELPDDLADPEPPRERGEPCKCALEISKALRPDYVQILEHAAIEVVPQCSVTFSRSALRARCSRTIALFAVMPSSRATAVTGTSSTTARSRICT